ncbi:MAG: molybdopterin-synthase adenylyltransferase MoeB, partial [Deltaproteobacteria bacterium]
MNFTEEQIMRYSRHIILREVGGKGQEKICKAKVFIMGAGGLGSPAALYLAAAGVGTIGIADNDVVDISNLQRQVLHTTADVGKAKVFSAEETLSAINPNVKLIAYKERITSENVKEIIRDYDIVLDGSDNFPTRYLINDACFFAKKTLISGSILRFDGQATVFKSHAGGPCYRCLYPEIPPAGFVPSCSEAGILGPVAGTIGVLQATEALKDVLGLGDQLIGRLSIFDALTTSFKEVKVRKDP